MAACYAKRIEIEKAAERIEKATEKSTKSLLICCCNIEGCDGVLRVDRRAEDEEEKKVCCKFKSAKGFEMYLQLEVEGS
jgi:hypothetical protein